MHARLEGADIYFDVDGMGLVAEPDRMVERPIVFLLHGGPGGDHSSFKSGMSELRDVAQLVYVDHRGAGRSRVDDPTTCTLEQNVRDVDALRGYLGLEKICVFGSSYGGMVAQGYAIEFPKHLDRLILSVTAPSYRFIEESQTILEERGTAEQKRVCQWLWDASFENEEQLQEYYRVMGPMYAVQFDAEKHEQGWRRGIRNYQQLNQGFGGFLRTFDFIEQLPSISCPTLVLAGSHDWICPPSQSQLIADKIPHAQLELFANSSHMVSHDEPERFLEVVRKFLGQ
jgi:proline iminopeptidase|tara:strand:- start:266 stop:1120 length:855 start_codon:yes stop_codon:yes gene_type:complete